MKHNNGLVFYILTIVNFYIVPIFINDTDSAVIILLVIVPFINFLISLFYGVKLSFNFFYPLIVSILFLPTIFINYNFTAWAYILVFGIIALLGMTMGNIFRKKHLKKNTLSKR